jgi:hypothetical protein
MSRVLHLTNHVGTTKNINAVFNQLNIIENLKTENWDHGIYICKNKANEIYLEYKEKIKNFDILIFTDLSMIIARPFLQNINEHNLFIIIYITNRFDWGVSFLKDKDNDFYNMCSLISNHPRVFFCADNSYDYYFAQIHKINFYFNDPIKLSPILQNIINNISNKLLDKLFIYNRGSSYESYKQFLYNNHIEHDVFGEKYSKYRDLDHICEYKAVLHFPYQVNTQSLWEYLAYNIIYFLPSKKFIYELINNTSWYYWEEKNRPFDLFIKSIEISEWYIYDHKDLFIYFDSWEELKLKFENLTNDEILKKKQLIHEFMESNNKINLEKWNILISEKNKYNMKYSNFFDKRTSTFIKTYEIILKNINIDNIYNIVELGTSRSYVNGYIAGCGSTDIKYWNPLNPNIWDWGAGIFTKVFDENLHNMNYKLWSIDPSIEANIISSNINNILKNKNVILVNDYSTNFLNKINFKIDLLYMDHMDSGEEACLQHLKDVKLIIKKDLINKNGIILIDDVDKNLHETKGKYSIPYLLDNGFELILHNYQALLRKI